MRRQRPRAYKIAALFRRFPRLSSALVGVILSLLLIAAVEGIGHLVLRWQAPSERIMHPENWTASSLASEMFAVGGEVVYDVTYTMDDQFRRRTVPDNADAARVLLFFGCSYTFGQGVADRETLPSNVAQRAPEVRVLNYAFMGQGTQHMYTRLLDEWTLQDAKPEATDLVYVFIAPHVARVIGSMRVVTGWGADFPWFELDNQGGLAARGTFRNLPESRRWFYNLMDGEAYLLLFRADIPFSLKEADYRLAAKLIEESREIFFEKVPGGRFTVVVYPAKPNELAEYQAVIPHLQAAQIDFIDYSELFIGDPEFDQLFYAEDRHPTALAHERLAAKLVEDLQLTPTEPTVLGASE
ncbi:MAG: hypothetical protein WD873_06730 [Candidatus Hydrogenedentales bacterium]